ncbi:MBL fold metallo-hydrolase [Candidatus Methylacidiphilum infernorum]|uniref:Zn-dependent hydrolase, glyoxylase family n=1 Tax=Methylacidiphilum infernorum (isolate V4) TaxID=481448 RepID=B3DWM0_METI4|nr:MBL fold metallo-hydrolase [Candidatus Methylacidiphilum infernorum]ACD83683.1 Zn-dependent hydrolase, glyoxylase family [Methylacidiphilum infernorum V4]
MIPLEDNYTDVIAKAQRGLNLTDSVLAAKAGVSVEELRRVKEGEVIEEVLERIAPVLGLGKRALLDLAKGIYYPKDQGVIPGLFHFNTRWEDMTVNSYLVWDKKTKEAAVFDTGGNCTEMLDTIKVHGLNIKYIFLTHTHADHIAELGRLKRATGAPAYCCELEMIPGTEPFHPGREFQLSGLSIRSFLTNGHSPGGVSYYITGAERKFVIVGDSLFAGSMGGGNYSYAEALKNNKEKILALPEDTIVCPGHGPLTTVGEEKIHNPFFAFS